jgi:flagellar motor switch protein FliN/FliY
MATQQAVPSKAVAPAHPPNPAEADEANSEQALVPSPRPLAEKAGMVLTAPLARLPVELDVAVPVREFRVRDLLALEPGQVIETQWGQGNDMPLASGDVQLAWSEFEVVDSQLAVRVTRMV